MKRVFIFAIFAFTALLVSAQEERQEQINKLLGQGVELHDEGRYDEAIKLFNKALKIDPKNGTAIYEKAYTLYCQGKKADARKLLEKGIKTAEGDKFAMYELLGTVYDVEGEPLKAIETYELALNEYDGIQLNQLASISYNLGIAYYSAHDKYEDKDYTYLTKALNNLSKSFVVRPLHANTNWTLYDLYSQYGFMGEALSHFCLFALNCDGNPNAEIIDETINAWTELNPEETLYQTEQDSLVLDKVIQIGKRYPSEFGLTYDVLYGLYSDICASINDEAVHPATALVNDPNIDAVPAIFADIMREGELETLMHMVAASGKKYITNANWLATNDDRREHLLSIITGKGYLSTLNVSEEESDTVEVDNMTETNDAKVLIELFFSTKAGTAEAKELSSKIMLWAAGTSDVNIEIGDKISELLEDKSGSLLIAYTAACARFQLEKGIKETTPEAHEAAMQAVLKYYKANRDVIGNIKSLDEQIK